ncbi:MAG: Do family serine endopeptidase [Proteobacteria bacterium]|nr:Do family serine endopeptidase [Pseudomonadota bacterium]MDA1357725.1 Do family serine endopeptidase [Pseudomonadota bacterium]
MSAAYRLLIAGLIVWTVLLTLPGPGAARSAPDSFADLVEKLTPAVVNIATSFSAESKSKESPFGELPPGTPPEEFYEFFNRRGGAPTQPITSLGSGFIIDPSGLVVTNNHVIADADEITVVLNDNSRLNAKVIGRDPKTDLALLKVESGKILPFVQFGNSDGARVGDWVIAIGNPFGLGNTVTAGILSARGRDINAGPYDDFLQTDAPINRGNSGGPMFDMNGKVIGVNTLIYSPSGGSVGIGFATPSAIVGPVIAQLREFGQTRRGWLGVRIQSVSPEIAESQQLAATTGALVAAVIEHSPAAAGGILQGDIILRFDGQDVSSRRALPRIVADTLVGSSVPVIVWREGEHVPLDVTIGRLEEYELANATAARAGAPLEMEFASVGLTLAHITAELREKYSLADESTGVVVTGVSEDIGEHADLVPGDLIVGFGSDRITDLSDFRLLLDMQRQSDSASIVLFRQRGDKSEFITVEINRG